MLRRYIRERTEAGGNFSFFSFTDPRLRRELVSGVTKFYHDARVDMLKVVVELLDVESGEALPGYAADDCTPVQEDNVAALVSWGAKALPSSGKAFRLHFMLYNARLYSYAAVPSAISRS